MVLHLLVLADQVQDQVSAEGLRVFLNHRRDCGKDVGAGEPAESVGVAGPTGPGCRRLGLGPRAES